MIPVLAYVIVGAALFMVGVTGVLIRRHVVVILMSVELMLNAANINLIVFSRPLPSPEGRLVAVFILLDALAQFAVGLALARVLARNRASMNVDENRLLRW